jgi:FkbM family methyltransferase
VSIVKYLQQMLRSFGVNVTRLPPNRFDAMPDVLQRLAKQFTPTRIVDVGANCGQWASTVAAVFPRVPLHLIEPQAACRPALDAFAAAHGAADVHEVAVSKPGRDAVLMVAAVAGSTGAYVARAANGRTDATRVQATTIDCLLGPRIGDADHLLMKLDVEGHEFDVLEGSTLVLPHVDVIICEVQFFDIEQMGNPIFVQAALALDRLGFVLYDIAGLGARPRDGRLNVGDAVFVRRGSVLVADDRWE